MDPTVVIKLFAVLAAILGTGDMLDDFNGTIGIDGMMLDQESHEYQSYQSDNPDWESMQFYQDDETTEWHIISRPNIFGSSVTRQIDLKFSGIPRCTTHTNAVIRIPTCFKCILGTYWINFNPDLSMCMNRNKCSDGFMHSDCRSCGDKQKCDKSYMFVLDDFTCQKVQPAGKTLAAHDVTDICKVGTISLKQCRDPVRSVERISWYYINKRVYFVEGMKIIHQQDPRNILSYRCLGKCKTANCRKGMCDGSPEFCMNFGCLKSADCKCAPKEQSGYYQVKSKHGETITPKCIGSSEMVVFRNKIQVKRRSAKSCVNCVATCHETGVHLKTQTTGRFSYRVCRSDYCIVGNATGSPTDVEMPHSMLMSTRPITIDVWLNNAMTPTPLMLECTPKDLCSIIKCSVCVELWKNPTCYTNWTRLIIAAVALSSLAALALTLWLLALACTSTVRIFKVICCCCYRNSRGSYRRVRFSSDEESPPVKPRKVRRIRSKFALLSLCLLVYQVDCCSITSTFQVTSSACVFGEGGLESCRVSNEVRLSVAPVGQDSCYVIRDPESKILGSIIIRTESVNLVCNPEDLYYVPEAESRCLSSRNCWKAGKCTGTNCENWKPEDNIDGQPQSAYGTGWSFCKNSCGCAGCGCFYCVGSCLFYRKWLVNPKKRAYKVSKCNQWTYEVDITILRTTASSTRTERITLRPGTKETAFEVDLTLISVSTPPQPVLDECILLDSTSAGLVPCNLRGSYSMGKIGEVQCHSRESAEALDRCMADHKLITETAGDDSVTCRSSLVSPSSSIKIRSLPLHLEGMMIATNGSKLVATLHSIALLEMQISSDELTLSAQTDKSHCFVEVISVSGCYSCLTGVDLSLRVNTDFGSAVGSLECQGINMHTPIRVMKKPKEVNVTFHASKPIVNSECTLKCPAGNAKFHIQGTLVFIPPPDSRSKTQSLGIKINPRNSTISLPSLAWDLMSSSVWIKLAIGLVITGGLILLMWLVIRSCKSRSTGILLNTKRVD